MTAANTRKQRESEAVRFLFPFFVRRDAGKMAPKGSRDFGSSTTK
jgi:hypothetical protein